MMHITEDTPPDMLAGAMDLTVHLPNGRSVKMSVERSTPMMDLLVQIVTAHQLQLSGHIIQALEMAPSAGISDKVLPYKPNTPIGALDTQHIKVVPKNRNSSIMKNLPSGHQPFESTFRLKVHLPRNQLYVTRVSQNIYLDDIMNKVCKEKNLDPSKYEFRHPGNLDEVLDPKLTLSDYQITEIYVVSKGTGRLTQAFSTSDIMALRKEEERKQFQAKTGGGVFNLIFKRGKSNAGNGSISSDNRSISPTHSDDSRSVTPPNIPSPPIIKEPPPPERPKPPQRKRRPAPKPPQTPPQPPEETKPEKPTSQISNTSNNSENSGKKAESSLLICHSRNSSDSSGYHEASILSDNCNTSLPRRPKTMIESEDVNDSKLSGEHSRSTGNLAKTSTQYKSTSSLAVHGRKKKAAPPPPPLAAPIIEASVAKTENASPVVASQPVENLPVTQPVERSMTTNTPIPARRRNKIPRTESIYLEEEELSLKLESVMKESPEATDQNMENTKDDYFIQKDSENSIDSEILEEVLLPIDNLTDSEMFGTDDSREVSLTETYNENIDSDDLNSSLLQNETINPYLENISILSVNNNIQTCVEIADSEPKSLTSCSSDHNRKSFGSLESIQSDLSLTSTNSKGSKPEIVGVIPKKRKQAYFDTLSRKRGFHIGSSLVEDETMSNTSLNSEDKLDLMSLSSKMSDYSSQFTDIDMNDFNEDIFKKSVSKATGRRFKDKHVNELLGIHDLEVDYKKNNLVKNQSASSLKSMDSLPGFMNGGNIKKWNNVQDLDDISINSTSSLTNKNKWIVGDCSDTESVSTLPTNQTPPESIPSSLQPPSTTASATTSARTSSSHVHNVNIDKIPETIRKESPEPDQKIENITEEIKQTESDMNLMLSDSKNEADSGICEKEDLELETVWKYQLPSPPKAFRDASPAVPTLTQSQYDTETLSDSVVTNPELFEKLQYVKDIQDIESDIPSVISEDEKEMCNKLTLEHLEKRKSLVYNRELATSLKFAQETDSSEKKNFNTIKSDIINELEDVITNSNNSTKRSSIDSKVQNNFKNTTLERNLPNFQISSYDTKKEKINIFEDDSIRSNVNLSRSNSKVTTTTTDTITNGDSNLKTTSSLENIPNASHRNRTSSESSKNDEQLFKKPQEISTYRLKNSFFDKNKNINAANVNNGNVNRSGSFSASNETWTPVNRIKRSKSHITLNKYMENNADNVIENLAKSSSLLDMSASLQSLQVMKTIQNKLSHSKEELDNTTKNVKEDIEQTPIVEPKPQVLKTVSVPSTNTTINYARGPPAVNLGTWSQRPKSQVTLKEDTDYKINTVNTKLNSTNYENDYRRNSSLKTSNFTSSYIPNNNSPRNSNGVSVKVNGESISTQKSGNVVIKIGGNDSNKEVDSNTRFINHITPDGYRKPLGNVNKIERSRPHSIAYDNQFDISRVPVVRSVELKKPFKDLHNNKSITQIYSNNIEITEDGSKSLNYSNSDSKNEKQSNVYLSNESINKPVVFRNNSFTPLVKGFRTDNSTSLNRKVWSVYGTLPSKPEEHNELNTNKNVPFSQMNLRRTESNKVLGSNTQINSNNNNIFSNVVLRNNSNNFKTIKDDFKVVDKVIPSPPPILKDSIRISKPIEKNVDPRADLLSAIRNFGGKKGLRTSKG